MPATFEAVPIVVGTQTIGTVNKLTLSVKSNGEEILGSTGWLGESTGIVTTDGKIDKVIPTDDPDGQDVDLLPLVISQVYANFGVVIGGAPYTFTGKIYQGDIEGDNKVGKTTGSFSYRGGAPVGVGF